MTSASPLSDAAVRTTVWCSGIGLGARLARRLAELGLRPGAAVTVMSRTSGAGLIVSVSGLRVALDAQAAAGIRVRTTAPEPALASRRASTAGPALVPALRAVPA